jgi:hypothetical protein
MRNRASTGESRLRPSSPIATTVCSLVSLCVVACTSGASAGADGGAAVFVAQASDFSGFHSWPSTPGVGPPGAPNPSEATDGGIHFGPMTTYINQKPPHGSTSFPVGTIIVKEQNDPAFTDRQIFAMVKRGGGFNLAGAANWEFYELKNVDANDVEVLWSVVPLSSDPYASNPNVCNDCHVMAKANDFVWTAGLTLSSF